MRIPFAFLFFLGFVFIPKISFTQSVVISGYFNAADPRDEWTELIVISDNTDMRNWTLRDNNSTQTSWQTPVTFNNIAFWNNMRAGTIIMIWHRPITSGAVAHTLDANKADGYIEVDATNTTYFNGGAFGTSPTWAGNSLNIAGGADVLELRDATATHIHALGHNSAATGTDWNALPSPKLNHNNNASSGDAIYICPGDVIADYGTTAPQAGTTWTSKNSATITFGLPNTSGGSPIANTAYWDTLREPVFSNQVIAPSSVVAGNPGSISFSWTAATDPFPSDATTGYIILRNTSNSFIAPADGTTYTTGATLGTATILAQIASSGTTSYTDNTVMNGNAYYYRVYAFRYGTDDVNGNTYHRSRGRAYTSTYAEIQQVNPLPVVLIAFSGKQEGQAISLSWTTASEENNDYFVVEHATDEMIFEERERVNGNGNSSQLNFYSSRDDEPAAGNNYYRLKQVDFNGAFKYSNIISVNFSSAENENTVVTWNTEAGVSYILSGWNDAVTIEVFDINGNILFRKEINEEEAGDIPLNGETQEIFFLRFSSGTYTATKKILR
jgi:hypothetical protein